CGGGARSRGRLGDAGDRAPRRARAGRDRRCGARRPPLHRLAVPARRAGARPRGRRRLHLLGFLRLALDAQPAVGDPRRAARRDRGTRRRGARHVGLSRVLYPGPGRLRDGVARAPARTRSPAARAGGGGCLVRGVRMPSLSTYAVFLATAIVLLLVPGPAVLYVVTRSIEMGKRGGLASVAGITTG